VKPLFTALLSGLLFGVGLCISGMTDPKNVIAFLDVTGHWSPKLAGVMLGAVSVHAAWLRWGTRRAPGVALSLAPSGRVNAALLGGAALFGVGWGLAGYCPGPAIVALGSGAIAPLVFVSAMLAGMALNHVLGRQPSQRDQSRSAVLSTNR
jgi:uncharacterized protein